MYLNRLQQDSVFIPSEVKSLEELTGIKARRGMENVIISNGKIVNVVSKSYGHIPNELFFKRAELLLINTDLTYERQTINRSDRSFVVDFIITDQTQFSIKNDQDIILPMLRFVNSYDGSEKTSGHFGFYRKICNNGLHVVRSQIAFSIKHSGNCKSLVMPNLQTLFENFMDNEFYSIINKFRELQEVKIPDPEKFVKEVLQQSKLFKFECSDTNDKPSKKAREVIEIIGNEAAILYQVPNLWLGYNAFNAVVHRTLKKGFTQQEKWDSILFDTIYQMV